ncbi:MAG: hypothetical protein BGO78_06895 [Chloroflexi bacterium 44-23]|nr:MAG: hypothetical protein BGO78_06895 [Chloroflexi bacterium 44-23]
MQINSIIPAPFYNRDVVQVARELIGKRLVRRSDAGLISGIISETEAYNGSQDLACHARAGRTARTATMYGPAGHAYIYFTYGMHWLLNVVTGEEGYPAAVLIRAILPQEGLDLISKNRTGVGREHWTDGPAKLTRALLIGKELNGINLTNSDSNLWIEAGVPIPQDNIYVSSRIGLGKTPEPWLSMPWRFRISDLAFMDKP